MQIFSFRLAPFLVYFLFLLPVCKGQAFNWQWSVSDTASLSSPVVADMVTDGNGNSYLFGQYYGSVSFGGLAPLMSTGQSDIFIVKYDNMGNALWSTSAGGSDFDISRDIAEDGNGNLYITGWYHSDPVAFGGTTHNLIGQRDIYVAKIDAGNGNFIWSERYGSNDFQSGHKEEGNAIVCDAMGNIYVAGGFRYTMDIPGLPQLQGCSQYITSFLMKLDPNGNGIWGKRLDCTKHWSYGSAEVQQLEISPGGHLYVGLRARGDTIFYETDTIINQQTSGQTHDGLLARYDLNGNFQWVRGIGGYGYDEVQALTSDAQGNCYIAMHREGSYGYLGIPGITHSGSLGTYKNVILKYAVNGDLVWGTRMGNSTYDHDIEAMHLEGNENLLVSGWHQGNFQFDSIVPVAGINGNYGIWIARYDSSKVLKEYYTARHTYPRGFSGMDSDDLGNTYLSGYFQDSLHIPGLPLMNYQDGTGVMFLTRFGDISTSLYSHTESESLFVSPVPSSGIVTVQSEKGFDEIRIYNTLGILVLKESMGQRATFTFNMERTGTFICVAYKNGERVGVSRIVLADQ